MKNPFQPSISEFEMHIFNLLFAPSSARFSEDCQIAISPFTTPRLSTPPSDI